MYQAGTNKARGVVRKGGLRRMAWEHASWSVNEVDYERVDVARR